MQSISDKTETSRKILNTLEANDLLGVVANHVDKRGKPSFDKLADFVMLSVEYIPELMHALEVHMVNQFLLWYPDSKDQTVDDLVSCAIDEFVRRYQEYPVMMMINPQTADKLTSLFDVQSRIEVNITNYILPGRVWLGSTIR